jgi:hypothetical protein
LIPPALREEIERIKKDIIEGRIKVTDAMAAK